MLTDPEKRAILQKVDHTLLRQDATRDEIFALCEDALEFSTASVCIPPRFVSDAVKFLDGKIPVCTVIGFPLGYTTARAKVAESLEMLDLGASELDAVIPVGAIKDGEDDKVLEELCALKEVCANRILKVIVETCLLTEDEKIRLCYLVKKSGADYIKTSTGFSGAGATVSDVRLFKETCPDLKVKAAGGIRDFTFAKELLDAGADRLGASALVGLCR